MVVSEDIYLENVNNPVSAANFPPTSLLTKFPNKTGERTERNREERNGK
jgi:hypothetical protein